MKSPTEINGKVVFSGTAERISSSSGGDTSGDEKEYECVLPQEITTGVYINSSLENTENSSFSIAKVSVSAGMTLSVAARLGTNAAACWVDSSGNRTLFTMGNSNSDINVNETTTVPSGAVYFECSYAHHLPCTITTTGTFIVVSTPTPISTTTGKYINNLGVETELSAMSYDKYSVSAGQWYHVSNRNGAASAAVCWVKSDGSRVVVLVGNTNDGVNINAAVLVPSDVPYMEVSYVNSQLHSVTLIKEA